MNLISEEKSSNLNFSLSYVLREIKMDCKDRQAENALSPMLVTESGMVTDCKESQPKNAQSPMLVTESGMVTECKNLQKVNAQLPILVTESGMVKFSPFDK